MKNLKALIINPPIGLTDKPRNISHGLAILANGENISHILQNEWKDGRCKNCRAIAFNKSVESFEENSSV